MEGIIGLKGAKTSPSGGSLSEVLRCNPCEREYTIVMGSNEIPGLPL
jgi:hypothetical protein